MLQRSLVVLLLWFLLASSLAFSITITVSSPTQSSYTSSPLHLVAKGDSSYAITGWAVYADNILIYTGSGSPDVDDYVAIATGSHQVVVRVWDGTGAYASANLLVNVSPDGLPSPPKNARTFNNIQTRANWGQCNSAGCAGGSGNGAYWMAQNQGVPSLSGSSMELFNSGEWANALFWQKLGAYKYARNLLWDFYFYVDSSSLTAAQSLEFDAFQFIGGYNYMIGSQCNYGYGVWDTWDEAAQNWIHTNISCPKFAPDTWHHVQWYVQTIPKRHQYKYVTLVVDGQSTPVGTVGNALYLGWADNSGAQWQLDVNQTGNGYHEWVDRAKLTMW